jgi:hypothetical protein
VFCLFGTGYLEQQIGFKLPIFFENVLIALEITA